MGTRKHAGLHACLILALWATWLAVPAGAGAQGPSTPEPTGAPQQATVEMDSAILEIPGEAFGLGCLGITGCHVQGDGNLLTYAEVPVTLDPETGTTSGEGSLPYLSPEGVIQRRIDCQSAPANPFVSQAIVTGVIPGELAVSDVRNIPGTNALSVTLNPAGENSQAFPRELVLRAEGGCGVPKENLTQENSLWYYHFTFAHQDEWQQDGAIKVDGLSWDSGSGTFVKKYERPVAVNHGPSSYTVQERTSVEVRPTYCTGPLSHISSATSAGQSLGLDGMRFYAGQVITAPAKSIFRFADGSEIEVDQGASFKVDRCLEKEATFSLTRSVRKMWFEVLKTLSGSDAKFKVRTGRAVAGVRGTRYALTYNERKQLTRVAVKEGKVSLKGVNGAKGEVLIKAGQVGVQKGKKRPQIVRG